MLYTKTGDLGYTDLLNNSRTAKNSDIIELIGTIDEFSASLGISGLYVSEELKNDIEKLQNQLFSVMAELAGGKIYVTPEIVLQIEKKIDSYPDFNGFITSSDKCGYAYLNLSRCIIRRAERIASGMIDELGKEMFAYLNRLSDLVYAMSLQANTK